MTLRLRSEEPSAANMVTDYHGRRMSTNSTARCTQCSGRSKTSSTPHNLMNPGKIVTEDETLPIEKISPRSSSTKTASFRKTDLSNYSSTGRQKNSQSPQSHVTAAAAAEPSRKNCACARSSETILPKSPSPRSKANVMRSLVSGAADPATRSSPEFQKLASLCFNCRQCEVECPTNVRIPHLMIEAKAQAGEASGTDRASWFLSRAHFFGELGCKNFMADEPVAQQPRRSLADGKNDQNPSRPQVAGVCSTTVPLNVACGCNRFNANSAAGSHRLLR